MNRTGHLLRTAVAGTLAALCVQTQALCGTPSFLDQSQTYSDDVDRVGQTISLAQTFTPSVSGYLDHIMLWAGRQNSAETNAFVVSITDAQNGLPGSILGTVTQTSFIPDARSWYAYDFSGQGITLNAGAQYALVLSCPGSFNGIGVGASMSDLYPGGRELEQIGAGPWGSPDFPLTGNAGADLTFQAFMTPIPEPGVSALTLLGLVLFRRRRRE